MDASHVATGAITALLATVLMYVSKWPLGPLDLATASAIAGLLVAAGGALVKFYKSRTASSAPPVTSAWSATLASAASTQPTPS